MPAAKYLGIASTLFGIVPLVTGGVHMHNWFPLLPLANDTKGNIVMGSWNAAG